jgi:hypothetical protein
LSTQNQQPIKQSVPSVVQDDHTVLADPPPIAEPEVVQAPIADIAPTQPPPTEAPETPQAEELIPASVPIDHLAVDSLNPAYPVSGGAKEVAPMSVTVERPAVDVVPGMQAVEVEKVNELPPEVEGFLKTVEDHQDQIPQEIVIANPQTGQALPRVMAQPVIVLPITPAVEEEGKRKKVTHSVRWLVEWSWKIMKVFSGKVVYRKADSTT